MIFTPENIQSRLHEQPFTPMQIVTTTGQTYDVFHPDLVLVARRFIIVGLPSSANPSVADLVTRIPLVHVAEIRDLPPAAAPTNGEPG